MFKHQFLITVVLISLNSLAQVNRQVTLEPCLEPFYHGVASGDPLSDRVIIWTRVTPDSTHNGGPIAVSWRMATDTSMLNIVASGSVLTDASKDYTVKVDVTGLQPSQFYFYEFSAFGKNSVVGRTRTAPSGNADSCRFAVISCANFEAGFFNVYKVIKNRNDIDAVIHLGDYIYEYETGGYAQSPTANRSWEPANEIITLTDYRTRYSSYHLDEDLRKLHQQFPFIVVWDDHESANDAWMNGAENHQSNEGSWSIRKNNAKQAFFEWLPIRQTGPQNDPYQIFRNIQYGDLLELIMLDTRLHGRDEQAGTTGSVVNDPNRQLLGSDQFTWLGNRLSNSTARWKILAQQVMMAPLQIAGVPVNGDQWDGYPAERTRVYNHIIQNNINNVVVITGDIHSSWANDLPTSSYNSSTGAGSVGVEFVTPSVTSPGLNLPGGATAVQLANSHVKFCNLNQKGFIILDVNKNRTQADWFFVSTIEQPSGVFSHARSHYVNNNERFIRNTSTVSFPKPELNHIQSNDCPRVIVTPPPPPPSSIQQYERPVIIGIHPNPVNEYMLIQYFNHSSSFIDIKIFDLNGRLIANYNDGTRPEGIFNITIPTYNLSSGTYIVRVETDNGSTFAKFIK
ncbi:MAG: alkaline phosphatase D family protein [Bacteroidia bacterium]